MSTQPHEIDYAVNGFSASTNSVPDVGRINATASAHERHGEAITRLEGLGYQLDRAFTRLEEATAQMLEAGVRVEPILPAHVEAALSAWRAGKVEEAPLPRPVL